MKDFPATNWGDIMVVHYASIPQYRRTESRRRFLCIVIDKLREVYDALWAHRCSTLHDNSDIDSLQVSEIDRRIRYYFDNKIRLFDSGDYDRFHQGMAHTLTLPIGQKRVWLATMSLRQLATEKARKRLHCRIKPITSYFPPRSL